MCRLTWQEGKLYLWVKNLWIHHLRKKLFRSHILNYCISTALHVNQLISREWFSSAKAVMYLCVQGQPCQWSRQKMSTSSRSSETIALWSGYYWVQAILISHSLQLLSVNVTLRAITFVRDTFRDPRYSTHSYGTRFNHAVKMLADGNETPLTWFCPTRMFFARSALLVITDLFTNVFDGSQKCWWTSKGLFSSLDEILQHSFIELPTQLDDAFLFPENRESGVRLILIPECDDITLNLFSLRQCLAYLNPEPRSAFHRISSRLPEQVFQVSSSSKLVFLSGSLAKYIYSILAPVWGYWNLAQSS